MAITTSRASSPLARRLPRPSSLASAALVASLLTAGLGMVYSAHAATIADVQLVDRISGQRMPLYQHQGELWVAGRPGANYSIDITNRTGRRIMAVISVDGVNAITGKSATAAPDDGYVFNPWQNWAITGWRKSDSQVAAFYFSESDASYASRTGRPRDVGVIGVALFRERVPEPVRPAPPVSRRNSPVLEDRMDSAVNKSTADSRGPAAPSASPTPQALPPAAANAPSPAAADMAMEAEATAKPSAKRAPSAQADGTASMAPRTPSLGTGHGALESSHTSTTSFDSASQQPAQIVRIRYDSYANLVAKGVIRDSRPQPERRPNAFPADPQPSYVPDPPRY